jgi:hypothetical protein
MAGIFGDEINTRADFFMVLRRAKALAAAVLRKRPMDPTLDSVKTQLDAIDTWTTNGRHPTIEERSKVGLGLRMYREFEQDPDADIQALRDDATTIQNYFRHWPDDATARDPNNADHEELA